MNQGNKLYDNHTFGGSIPKGNYQIFFIHYHRLANKMYCTKWIPQRNNLLWLFCKLGLFYMKEGLKVITNYEMRVALAQTEVIQMGNSEVIRR